MKVLIRFITPRVSDLLLGTSICEKVESKLQCITEIDFTFPKKNKKSICPKKIKVIISIHSGFIVDAFLIIEIIAEILGISMEEGDFSFEDNPFPLEFAIHTES